jgi:hypothetical protein
LYIFSLTDVYLQGLQGYRTPKKFLSFFMSSPNKSAPKILAPSQSSVKPILAKQLASSKNMVTGSVKKQLASSKRSGPQFNSSSPSVKKQLASSKRSGPQFNSSSPIRNQAAQRLSSMAESSSPIRNQAAQRLSSMAESSSPIRNQASQSMSSMTGVIKSNPFKGGKAKSIKPPNVNYVNPSSSMTKVQDFLGLADQEEIVLNPEDQEEDDDDESLAKELERVFQKIVKRTEAYDIGIPSQKRLAQRFISRNIKHILKILLRFNILVPDYYTYMFLGFVPHGISHLTRYSDC